MKFQLAVTALLASAVLSVANTGAVNAASDDDAGAPIRLTAVKIDANQPDGNYAFPGLITVSFTNVQEKTVDEVVFGLRDYYGHLVYEYRDVGPFAAKAVLRNHTFTDSQLGNGQSFVVDSVKFHDGTTWYPGTDAPRARRQTTAAALSERASR